VFVDNARLDALTRSYFGVAHGTRTALAPDAAFAGRRLASPLAEKFPP
jgi:hypothetical protein